MCMTKQTEEKSVKREYKEDILREFLERNRAEARAMSIYEYNQEEHIRLESEDAFEDGRKSGENRLGKLIEILLAEGLDDIVKLVATDEKVRENYYTKYNI